jgi:predicted DNA-binding protein (MmcQ/YjbR family)
MRIIDFCLTFPFSYEDYPFDLIVDEHAWTVMRQSGKQKVVCVYLRTKRRAVHQSEMRAAGSRSSPQAFRDVTPRYHMNKTYWKTIMLAGDVQEQALKRMIGQSYDLIKPKRPRGIRNT